MAHISARSPAPCPAAARSAGGVRPWLLGFLALAGLFGLVWIGLGDHGLAPSPARDAKGTELRLHLANQFGLPGLEASWYRSLRKVEVDGGRAILRTDLPPGDRRATSLCNAASGHVFRKDRPSGLSGLQVLGARGEVLAQRMAPAEPCR